MKNIKSKERREKLLEASRKIEPVFDPPLREQDIRLTHAYQWYGENYSLEEGKEWLRTLLRREGCDSDFIESITTGHVPMIYGTISRLMLRNVILPEQSLNYLRKFIRQHVVIQKVKEVAKPTVKLVDVNQEKIDNVIHEFNMQLDRLLSGKPIQFSIYNIIKKNELKKNQILEVESIIIPQTYQLRHAVKMKNSPYLEYYENYTKKELKILNDFYNEVASDIKRCINDSKIIRKPRKQKPVRADKVVSKVQYKKEDKEFKITSIDPKNILESTTLIVFNTKYKQMSVYVAEENKTLSIKGTTIQNFDSQKSIRKVIRKPDESINNVLRGNSMHVMRYITGLSTRAAEPTGRINSDTCILRAIK